MLLLLLSVLFHDKKRNRIKTLEEYYHIKANITSDTIAKDIFEQDKRTATIDSPPSLALLVASMPICMWVALILWVPLTKGLFLLSLFIAGSAANSSYWYLIYGAATSLPTCRVR